MHPQLKQAYNLGVLKARSAFEKHAVDPSTLTTALGGVPLVGPALAGHAAGRNTPFDPQEISARTTAKSSIGQGLGGVGGALLGAGLGAGGTALYNKLRDRSVGENFTGSDDASILKGTSLGALLGAGLGTVAGGAYGAHEGQQDATNLLAGERLEDLLENRQEEVAKQMRNQRILRALTQAHQIGGHGLPLRVQIPPRLAALLQAQQRRPQ